MRPQVTLCALLASFDLLELELDWRRATEDRHRHLDSAAVEIEFLDQAVEGRERTVENLDLIADLVVDLDLLLGRRGVSGGGGEREAVTGRVEAAWCGPPTKALLARSSDAPAGPYAL